MEPLPVAKKSMTTLNYQSLFLLLIYNTRLIVKSQGEFSKMATTTLNGKPNLFLSPEPPIEILPTYPVRVVSFAEIAEQMVTENEVDLDAAEQDWLNDPEIQQEYQEWCEKLDEQWRDDPEAQRQFEEWCNEQQRLEKAEADDEMTAEEEEHLCSQYDADAHENSRLGEAYLIGANTANDLKWQAGGKV